MKVEIIQASSSTLLRRPKHIDKKVLVLCHSDLFSNTEFMFCLCTKLILDSAQIILKILTLLLFLLFFYEQNKKKMAIAFKFSVKLCV